MSITYFKEKLKKDNLCFKKIKKILIKTNSFIAGSYIVQTLLEEDWYEKDIDIYTIKNEDDDNDKIEPLLYDYFINKLEYQIDTIDNINNLSNNNKYREDLFITRNIYKIINLKNPDSIKYPNINIIILKSSEEEEEEEEEEEKKLSTEEKEIDKLFSILNDFDLKCCSIVYNPSISDNIIAHKSECKDDCIDKIININPEYINNTKNLYQWLDTLRRIFKYMRRGFVLSEYLSKNFSSVIIDVYIKNLILENPSLVSCFIDKWNKIIFQNYDINIDSENTYFIPIILPNTNSSYLKHEFIIEMNRLIDNKKHIRKNYKIEKKTKYNPCYINIFKFKEDIEYKGDRKPKLVVKNIDIYNTYDMSNGVYVIKKEALSEDKPGNVILSNFDRKKSILSPLIYIYNGLRFYMLSLQ